MVRNHHGNGHENRDHQTAARGKLGDDSAIAHRQQTEHDNDGHPGQNCHQTGDGKPRGSQHHHGLVGRKEQCSDKAKRRRDPTHYNVRTLSW